MFNLGVPIYYFTMARKLFGKSVLYPLMRLAHLPERILSRKLYLNLNRKPRYEVPESVPIPEHRLRPALSELELIPGPNT